MVDQSIYKTLFRGREDVYAKAMISDGKNVFMPAREIDWKAFAEHKANGGTMKNFDGKSYSRLTDKVLLNHISDKETIGIYPLLEDNSSWFITANFTDIAGLEQSISFARKCEEYRLPVYIESLQKAARVWLFFQEPCPAIESRKLFSLIGKAAGIILSEKTTNYIVPNQDKHTGKGFGNLIILPLQKTNEELKIGFIDWETRKPCTDQWSFLSSIERVPIMQIQALLNTLSKVIL